MKNKYQKIIPIKKAIQQHNKTLVELWNSHYSRIMSYNDIVNINRKSSKIINFFNMNKRGKILIAGRIQSGKTSFFINLIANFFDNNLKIGYVAAGTTKILFNQNKSRIINVFNKKVFIYDKYEIENNFNENVNQIINQLKNNNKILFVGLKSKKHIDFFKNILEDIKNHTNINHSFFIDDEGDQASFDNILSKETTATHKSIQNLLINHNVFFVSITATPFAHEFVSDSIIKPDKVFVLETSSNYTDLSLFKANNLYKIISENEKQILLNKNMINNSLKAMLLEYFITCAYFQLIKGDIYDTSAIVHTHTKNEKHNQILKFIEYEIKQIQSNINSKKYDSFIWEIIHQKNMEIDEIDEFADFKKLIFEHIQDSKVLELNQTRTTLNSMSHNTIYVGAYLMGRGITFNNLLSVYYCNRREASISNADTILQRVRWLGYRNNYIHMMTIYIDKTSYVDIVNLEKAINNKYNEWITQEDNDKSFKENNLIPKLEVGEAYLRATRTTISNNGKQMYNESYQDRSIINDKYAEWLHKRILKNYSLLNMINKKFKYTIIENINNSSILTEDFKNHLSNLFDIPHFFKDMIKEFNAKLIIVNMNEKIRTRSIIENKINQLFEGRNPNYKGDVQFINDTNFKGNVVLQIHKVFVKKEVIYKFALILPYKFISNYVRLN